MSCLGEQALGPQMVELEWYDVLQKVLASLTLDDLKELAGSATATNGKT